MAIAISKHMTPSPHTIGQEQSMAKAHEIMRSFNIRHLPVLHGGGVVGIVTERDLHLLETLRDVRPEDVPVEDAMSPDPYTVTPDAPLAEVARHMAAHKFGAAIVTEGPHVVGIFSAVDGLRLLANMLEGASSAPAPAARAPAAKAAAKAATRPAPAAAKAKTAAAKPAARKAAPKKAKSRR